MRRLTSFLALALALALPLSFSAGDDKTGASDKKEASSKATRKTSREKVRSDLRKGKILRIEAAQRYLTLEVTTKLPRENGAAAQNIANLQRQLIGNRDINSIRNIQAEIMRHQQNLITYKDEVKKIEISLDNDDLKIRTTILPVEYDDKGKPRKLTEKEKRALKGSDPKAPGYEADLDSLKTGQTVDVFVVIPKASSKSKSKDKDAADEKERQKARMIVILSEPEK